MFRIGWLLIFTLTSVFAFAQKKKKAPRLEGFNRVDLGGKSIYVAVTETTSGQWTEFVTDAGAGSSKDLLLVKNQMNSCISTLLSDPDVYYRDTIWFTEKGKKQHTLVKCSQLPVTGVSFEQAQLYCAYLQKKFSGKWPGLVFRLPSPEEMTALLKLQVNSFDESKAKTENPYKKGINPEGCVVFNHQHNSWCASNIQLKNIFGYRVPFQVKWYFPSKQGIFELMGNVAEMTSEKGIAMGGSCRHSAAECQPGFVNEYDGPSYWLGFRVVAEWK